MKYLTAILLLLFVAASAALVAVRNPGYVLIAREPVVLETSLAAFVLLLVAGFLLAYAVTRLTLRLWRAPYNLKRWRQTRRTRRARLAFQEGLAHLLTGDWLKAEQSLLASLHAGDSPFLGNLAAALAAHGQHDPAKRDRYLAAARDQAGSHALAADLLQARLRLAAGELEPAHAALVQLAERHPSHPEIKRLLIAALRRLHDWQGLAQRLPEAGERQLLPAADQRALELETQLALLTLDLPRGALATLRQAWSTVPAAVRGHPQLIAAYARQLLRQDAADEALQLLSQALARDWQESLVLLYGEIAGPKPAAQLEAAEEWRVRHGDSASLLLTLGRLARRLQQVDKARVALERSLALGGGSAAHAELAQLFEAQGDAAHALEHYRLALARACPPPAAAAGAHPGPTPGKSDYGY
jgi:HemY protein